MATRVKGFEQITGLNTAKSLTVPDGARLARIQADTQNVRYRVDGVDPTASVGMLILTTEGEALELTIDGGLHDARFIEVSASAKLNVTYYG